MTETKEISPAPDRRVRKPNGDPLTDRECVIWSSYWERRATDRDIVVHKKAA